ncbi:MAG: hypothetical protein IKS71_06615 [Bacteroidales bacterium]|nr:hypothetical protein [Bacteroidales bacterium]
MKRIYLAFILFLLAAVTACVKEQDYRMDKSDEKCPEGKVNIRCSIRVPSAVLDPVGTETKALAENPTINTIHVAVFGSSGYMKEYVQAEEVECATVNKDTCTFNIRLSLNDSHNLKAHVIVNGPSSIPFTDEVPAMRNYVYTSGNQDGYWCRIELPNGIQARKEWVDSLQMYDYVKDEYGDYMVTDDVKRAFTNLPLVRNFAKIMVTSGTEQLVIDSMAIVSKPSAGSIAPYSDSLGRFISEYKDSSYTGIRKIYKGCVPNNLTLTDTDPKTVRFTANPSTVGQYMYERPATTNNPTYLLIHGIYYPMDGNVVSETGVPGYYKIDLAEDGVYYSILRNFRYNIRINSVSKPGSSSPDVAAAISTSGGVSSSTSPDVLDISDGYGRIVVDYYQQTLIEQTNVIELKYKFLPDEQDDNHPDNDAVVFTVNAGTSGNVISSTLSSEITGQSYYSEDGVITTANGTIFKMRDDDEEGYRTILFTSNEPNPNNTTSQKIRIAGIIPNTNTQIYREVTWYLMTPQTMYVSCTPSSVEDRMGEKTELKVEIPKELPESMFPLQFEIESSARSLTPNRTDYPDENLPVSNGPSLSNGSTPTFHYVYTLDRETYNALPDSERNGYVYFTTHYETNKANSACTIYVANKYFDNDANSRTTLGNYHIYDFFRPTFSNNYVTTSGTTVYFTFYMDSSDPSASSRSVKVTLYNLDPVQNSPLSPAPGASEDEFYYEMTGTSATLALKTINTNGSYGVKLECLDNNREIYHPSTKWNYDSRYYNLSLDWGTYGWEASSVNPDSNLYDSYQSTNKGVASSIATMRVVVSGYTEYKIYIRSNAQGNNDYVVVRNLDDDPLTSWSANSAYNNSKDYTRGRQNTNNGTSLSHYREVTFNSSDGLTGDDTQHIFYIHFGKNDSGDTNEDRGYVLIPKTYTLNTNVTVVISGDGTLTLNNSAGVGYSDNTNYSAGLANVSFTNSSGYSASGGWFTTNYYGRYIGTNNADGTITVSVPGGYTNFTITKIEYSFYNSIRQSPFISSGGGTLSTNGTTVTWTGNSTSSVVLGMNRGNSTSNRNVIASVKVYYSYDED